jgi:phage terminase large subunit-like protein
MPDSTAHRPLRPFTVDHFRAWTRLMVLDNGRSWIVEDFQLEPVADLFAGSTEVWMLVGEGNAKTTLMSGVALYYGDYRPDATVLLAAASRDQAGWLLKQAIGFVRRSPGASKRYRPLPGYRHVRCLRSGGVIQVFAADERTGDGPIYDLALLDELHRQRDLGLLRTWRGKADKRGGQLGVISTEGDPGSEFGQTVALIRERGAATPTADGHERIVLGDTVMHRWAVPEDGDVEDLEQVKAANPFSGITVASLRRKRSAPSMTEAHWRRLTCNQAVRGEGAAISAQEWQAAETNDRPERGTPVWCGLDLGWTWDTTAVVPLWVPQPGRRVLLEARIIVPPRDGTSTSPSKVQNALLEVHEVTPIHTVAMDKAAGGEQMAEWIQQTLGARVIGYTNGNAEQARCAQRFYEGLRAEPEPTLQHVGDPALTQHVMNARARMLPRGDVVFDRPSSTRSAAGQDQRVIDGLSAAEIVHDAAVAREQAPAFDLADYRIVAV